MRLHWPCTKGEALLTAGAFDAADLNDSPVSGSERKLSSLLWKQGSLESNKLQLTAWPEYFCPTPPSGRTRTGCWGRSWLGPCRAWSPFRFCSQDIRALLKWRLEYSKWPTNNTPPTCWGRSIAAPESVGIRVNCAAFQTLKARNSKANRLIQIWRENCGHRGHRTNRFVAGKMSDFSHRIIVHSAAS